MSDASPVTAHNHPELSERTIGRAFAAEWPHLIVKHIRGAIFEVAVYSRLRSRLAGFELTAKTGRALYVPKGFVPGFQTRPGATEAAAQISA